MLPARRIRAITQNFSLCLKQARARAKFAQQTLAERAGIDPVFVSFLENGHRQPTLAVLLSLEDALSIAPGTLMRRTAKRMTDATAGKTLASGRKSRPVRTSGRR